MRPEKPCCHSDSNEKSPANADMKNSEITELEHYKTYGHGVMVIVVGNGHSDTSSNPGRDWLNFT